MEPDATMMAADLSQIIDAMPHTLVWGDQSVSVSLDDIMRSDDLQIAGVFQARDVGAYAQISDFTDSTPPTVGDIVSVDGQEYRVGRVTTGPDGIGVQLSLVRKSN